MEKNEGPLTLEGCPLDVDVGLFQEVLQRHTVTGRSG